MSRRSWLSSIPDPQTFVGRAIRLPLRIVPNNRVVRVLGGINKGMHWITGSGTTHGCWIGNYEADHAAALLRLIRPGTVAYDIGANAGFYTLALSRLVGDLGHVFSFEPSARSVYFLRRHLLLNNIQNVTVIQTAISNGSGLVSFDDFRLDELNTYMVPSMSLDQFTSAGYPMPSFIKMDIEGVEKKALEASISVLSNDRVVWMLATHSDQLRRDCQELMTRYGYRFEAFNSPDDPGLAHEFLAIPGMLPS